MSQDFEKELAGIVTLIPPEHELAPETIPIATEALEMIDGHYGSESDNPLPFHNAPHSVGVTRRAVRMGKILLPYMRDEYRKRFFDLAVIAGATHDYDQDSGPGDNERNSAKYAIEQIEKFDGELNTTDFKARLPQGILATTVEMKDDGELVQTNLQSGSHDPIKFNMAFSDINGIAMEGSKRMWCDATNLYHEITDEPTAEGLYSFLIGQAGFLRQRLNDPRIKSDIAYYFPDDIEAVYKDMYKAFHANIISAYNIAVMLDQRPELQSSIGLIVKSIGKLDRSVMGSLIGKTLGRKLTSSD